MLVNKAMRLLFWRQPVQATALAAAACFLLQFVDREWAAKGRGIGLDEPR
jgi:hypothetical protein